MKELDVGTGRGRECYSLPQLAGGYLPGITDRDEYRANLPVHPHSVHASGGLQGYARAVRRDVRRTPETIPDRGRERPGRVLFAVHEK